MEIDNIISDASSNPNGIIWALANNLSVIKKMHMEECKKFDILQAKYNEKQKDFEELQKKFNASDKSLEGADGRE